MVFYMGFDQENIISIRDFSIDDVEYILKLAEKMEPIARSEKASNVLAGKILGMLFYEPSTRTRLSFETSMKRLGGSTVGFAEAGVSSVTKGENLNDTVKIVSEYVDAIVIRHNMDQTSLIPIILIAVVIDLIIGELPSKIHPVVLMGKCIDMFKHLKKEHLTFNTKLSGAIFTLTLITIFSGIFTLLLCIFSFNYLLLVLVSAILLSTTFSIKLLMSSAANVKSDLNFDIAKARKSISYLVSRDTSQLSQENIVSAVIETLTENITDSIVSPLFYTFIFGVVGGIAYRVVNTLDAMIGYKNPENIKIGWFPAKFDDLLNYIPARITGIFVTLAALLLGLDWKNSYRIMTSQDTSNDLISVNITATGYQDTTSGGNTSAIVISPSSTYSITATAMGKPSKKGITIDVSTIKITSVRKLYGNTTSP